MPRRWKYATKEGDVEDAAPVPASTDNPTFDGFWEATMADGDSTVVILSGKNVWHDGSQFASLKVLNQQTCALIMADDDVRGYLSADGQEIEWEDGDCWKKAKMEQHKGQQSFATPTRTSPHKSQIEPANNAWVKKHNADEEAVLEALVQRDAGSLQEILELGCPADIFVESEPLWREMGWTPEGDCQQMPLPLLVAAILLQWSEGVRICVEKKANVNATYAGPFPRSDGGTVQEKSGAPILRVALSAKGPAQCIICQHILSAKVRGRTFQSVRRKAEDEMDFVTLGLFDNFKGPFAES